MAKLTHKGVIRGVDARTPKDYRALRRLRETKLYWIDQYGHKYSKKYGGSVLGKWPMYRLLLESIQPLTTEGNDDDS